MLFRSRNPPPVQPRLSGSSDKSTRTGRNQPDCGPYLTSSTPRRCKRDHRKSNCRATLRPRTRYVKKNIAKTMLTHSDNYAHGFDARRTLPKVERTPMTPDRSRTTSDDPIDRPAARTSPTTAASDGHPRTPYQAAISRRRLHGTRPAIRQNR